GFFQHGKKGLCPQTTQNDAETEMEILFLFCVNRRVLRASPDPVAAGRAVLSVAKNVSTRSIVKKKRRKPQTSQDKAVATNYHIRQTSGKNQNREFFTIHFHDFFHNFKDGFRIFPGAST